MPGVREPAGPASPGEVRFNRRRQSIGFVLGPVVFLTLWLLPLPTLPPAAHTLAAILGLMVVLWMTEALPLAITALVGPALAVVLGVAPVRTAFAPFADPIIFLFIGSFMLAESMFVHGLDRRLAYTALASRWVGRSGLRLVLAYAGVAAGLSMWMSNTATTAMLFPLGLAVLAQLGRERRSDAGFGEFALALMLVTSFAASIGGLATPVGTPPNLIGIALLRELGGISISFVSWMLIGVPIMLAMMAFIVVWFLLPRARHVRLSEESRRAVAGELQKLGPVTRGERNVLIAFGVTVAGWVVPGTVAAIFGHAHPLAQRLSAMLPEAVAAILGAMLLFLLPIDWRARQFTLTWDQASRIDWGVVMLFGGGLAMGTMADSTGLSEGLGRWVAAEYPGAGTVGLTMVFTALAILMSEAASNTASANIVVPTAIAVSIAAGVSPLEPALGATIGASMGFMMPVSTPPNAIVYSSGYIPIGKMARHGIALDVAGFFVIVVGVLTLGWIVAA
ncbi:MAG TPA: DASS family sodium-coupled anion symporter [Vicinamibacterales bacterium]|nr:DASS family sodium-coupled anion symporter [Vicinamibacterales bacterium]